MEKNENTLKVSKKQLQEAYYVWIFDLNYVLLENPCHATFALRVPGIPNGNNPCLKLLETLKKHPSINSAKTLMITNDDNEEYIKNVFRRTSNTATSDIIIGTFPIINDIKNMKEEYELYEKSFVLYLRSREKINDEEIQPLRINLEVPEQELQDYNQLLSSLTNF